MLFEDIAILIAIGLGVFFIGIPVWKLVKTLLPKKVDPLVDAKERLDIARKEVEAARLNKEAEKLYSELYDEALEDETSDDKKHKEMK